MLLYDTIFTTALVVIVLSWTNYRRRLRLLAAQEEWADLIDSASRPTPCPDDEPSGSLP
ncbi:MAG: hypothetical protein JOZ53_27260 [Planctomycetaceae bacterium]|nr:hypothetical protein [Planctomycetaceae bacterium]